MRVRFLAAVISAVAVFVTACSGASHRTPLPITAAGHGRLVSGAQSDQYSAAVLADGPTAYYRLDDSGSVAADSSGNGLNGSIGANVKENVPGLLSAVTDTAVAVPGIASTAGTVNVPANQLLQPSTSVSLETWLEFTSIPKNDTGVVVYGNDNGYAPYELFFRSNGIIAAQFDLTSGVLQIAAPTALAANKPYYVVSTYDGTNGRLYINGSQVASASKSGTLTNYQAGYGFTMGDDAAFADQPFSGTLDEVAVYANKALSAAQVSNHYQAGTIVQNPSASPSPSGSPSATPSPGPNWLTMGYDLYRTGYNPAETTIGVNSFGTLHEIWSKSLGGTIGEPMLVTNVVVYKKPKNVLYVGTVSGKMYAINADTGVTLWEQTLGATQHTCGTKTFTFGIMSAPAVDLTTNRIYVADGALKVHALSLTTGAESPGWPIAIGQTPDHNFAYGGLTFNPANGLLYAETSATCDLSPWYGRIAAIDTATASIENTFYPAQGNSGGGIWGFGGGSIDPATNDVFVSTGNADTTQGFAQNAFYSEQIVALSADLNPVIEDGVPQLPGPGHDYDFGATPLLFQPPGCPPLLAAVNKSGVIVIYDRYNIDAGVIQNLAIAKPSANGDLIGVPSYDPVTNLLYVGLPSTYQTYKPGVAAFSITSNCALNPTPAWSAQFGSDGAKLDTDTPRSPVTIANGVAYVSDYGSKMTFAFNAATGALLWKHALNGLGITGPVVANGKLYIGSDGQTTMTAWSP